MLYGSRCAKRGRRIERAVPYPSPLGKEEEEEEEEETTIAKSENTSVLIYVFWIWNGLAHEY